MLCNSLGASVGFLLLQCIWIFHIAAFSCFSKAVQTASLNDVGILKNKQAISK